MCDKDNCNCGSNPCCGDCEPWNCVEQAVNDVWATKEDQIEELVERAETAATNSEASAQASAGSAAEAKEFRDEAEQAATTAVAAEGIVVGVANDLQDTADKLNQIADELGTAIAGISVVTWYYTAVSDNQTVIPVPSDKNQVDVQAIFIEGARQEPNRGFTYDALNKEITLAEGIPLGLEISIIIGTYSDNPNDFANSLASNNGASLVGTASGNTVQEELNQIETALGNVDGTLRTDLVNDTGAELIGTTYGLNLQAFLDTIKDAKGYYKDTFVGAKVVNIPTDYSSMQAAVDALHSQTTTQGSFIILNLESGYTEKYGLKVQHGDFSRFYIQSEDPIVNVADDFIGVVGPDGGTTITSGSVIMAYHANGPVLGCIFDGRQIARTLYFALGGSHGWADRLQSNTEEAPNPTKISGGKNFRHATFQAQEGSILVCENTLGTGCLLNSYYCERNSIIHCEFSDASGSSQAGVMATRSSRVNADSMNVSNCKLGMWASRGAVISAADAIADSCSVYGFYADMAATINAHNTSTLATGTNMPSDTGSFVNPGAAYHAYRGSKINCTSGKPSGSRYGLSAVIDSDIAGFGVTANNCITAAIFARYSSNISADNCSISGSLGSGVVASDASTVSANTGSVTNTTGTAVQAVNSSRISLASGVVTAASTGVYSDAGSTISVIGGTVNATVGLRVNRGGIISATGATYNNANITINTLNANGIIFA